MMGNMGADVFGCFFTQEVEAKFVNGIPMKAVKNPPKHFQKHNKSVCF